MDHFSRPHDCHNSNCHETYQEYLICPGCNRLRPPYKRNTWCKRCRKTAAYAEHLRRIEAWKEETKGMTTVEVFAHQMKKAYSKEFFEAFEKNSVEHTGLQ